MFLVRAFPSRRFLCVVALLALGLGMAGCDNLSQHTKIDRDRNLEVQDYRDLLSARNPRTDDDGMGGGQAATEPSFQSYIDRGDTDERPMPLVSVSVNETIPLKDVLYELARQADFDLILDPRIRGSIIFSARNRPLNVVLDQIAEIAALRYSIEDDKIRIEIDAPYTRNYKIDYVPLTRSSAGQIETTVDVSSSAGGGGGGSGATTGGSRFQIQNKIENDFWKDFSEGIDEIVKSSSDKSRLLRTTSTPAISVVDNPEPLAPEAAAPEVAQAPADIEDLVQGIVQDDDGSNQGQETPEIPQIEIQSIAEEPETATTPATATEGDVGETYTPYFKINRQASLLTVYANDRTHRQISDYVREITRQTTSQVLIEAKILEVSLNDEFSTGIDWGELEIANQLLDVGFARPAFTTASTVGSLATIRFQKNDDPQKFLSLLSRFGAVHGLASPRLTVLNNQPAVLNVARNRVYFELNIESSQNQTTTQNNVETEIKTVPEGVLINVFPSINLDEGTVMMTLRPTVSRITGFVDDPGVRIAAVQAGSVAGLSANLVQSIVDLRSPIPEVSVQEFDSIVRLRSGETIVMGGLLQDRIQSTQEGVPVLSETPMIGSLFRNQVDQVQKTEIVVMLKATILDDPSGSMHNTDRDLYRTFSGDRRPFADAY